MLLESNRIIYECLTDSFICPVRLNNGTLIICQLTQSKYFKSITVYSLPSNKIYCITLNNLPNFERNVLLFLINNSIRGLKLDSLDNILFLSINSHREYIKDNNLKLSKQVLQIYLNSHCSILKYSIKYGELPYFKYLIWSNNTILNYSVISI